MSSKEESIIKDKQSKRQLIFMDWTLDLLIYIVVLNFFAQHWDAFYFENFTYSVLTAIVLKAFLVIILSFEHHVADFFKRYKSTFSRYVYYFTTFSILFFSKFIILEAINIIFGHKVDIYGFIPLIVLIIALIVSRKLIEYIYKNLQ